MMKKPQTLILNSYQLFLLLSFFSAFFFNPFASQATRRLTPAARDTSVTAEIIKQLDYGKLSSELYYPQSVRRFYVRRSFEPIWTVKQVDQNRTWAAMLLIDCVLQFGLKHEDYHPRELLYDRLHLILEQPTQIGNQQKARFEIMLTDGIITLMNHLHFGKLNPYYKPSKIDVGAIAGFDAEVILNKALAKEAFMEAIGDVQPKSKVYHDLQHQLYLIKGLYDGDCYETPEADVRKIGINMERMRWADMTDSAFVQINIPTYALTFQLPDTAYQFKVMVGKPASPTPVFKGSITDFTTSAGKRMTKADGIDTRSFGGFTSRPLQRTNNRRGSIYFMLNKKIPVDFVAGMDKAGFKKANRAISDGSVFVEGGEHFANLLLKSDGASDNIKHLHQALMSKSIGNFILKKPVPLKITYITAVIIDGQLVKYNDVYNLDKDVETALYNMNQPLSTNSLLNNHY
jgi:murein L,D-transpeptidase YcbB/YkuD